MVVGVVVATELASPGLDVAAMGTALGAALFGSVLTYAALVDLRTRRIPNAITVPGLGLALAFAALAGLDSLASSALGAATALLVTGILYVVSRGNFGMGDVKLSGFIGAVIGVSMVPAFLATASTLAALAALLALATGRGPRTTIPLAPALATAGIVCFVRLGL